MTPIPPHEYVCPLTKELMKDPMLSRYGSHFEKKAILQWLGEGNNYCPVTGNPLRASNLISDKTLKWKIRYWAEKHGHDLDDEDENDDFCFGFTKGIIINLPDKRFLCPLTKEIMEDPVMSKHGHNFERKAIFQWFEEMGDVCPVTDKTLRPSDLATNRKLQWEIRQWQLSHGDASMEMSRLEYETKLSKAEMASRDFHISDILRALTLDEGRETETKEAVEDETKMDTDAGADRPAVLSVLDEVVDALDI